MKSFFKLLAAAAAVIGVFAVVKLAFEITDSSAKKYYTVDRGV